MYIMMGSMLMLSLLLVIICGLTGVLVQQVLVSDGTTLIMEVGVDTGVQVGDGDIITIIMVVGMILGMEEEVIIGVTRHTITPAVIRITLPTVILPTVFLRDLILVQVAVEVRHPVPVCNQRVLLREIPVRLQEE